jgi:cytokinin riboside 5'-monophosphate phosphoribohydrolase
MAKKRVLVFCSSSNKVAPILFSEAENFSKALIQAGYGIVYGGGMPGLMGRIAQTALAHGGEVIGVIPNYLNKPGITQNGLTELIVVDDLLDRKKKMLSLADAVVAFPGGIGTIDEITEALALKQLGETEKPMIFHNFLGFWEPLMDYFKELQERHMISQDLNDLYSSFDETQDVMEHLKQCCPIG